MQEILKAYNPYKSAIQAVMPGWVPGTHSPGDSKQWLLQQVTGAIHLAQREAWDLTVGDDSRFEMLVKPAAVKACEDIKAGELMFAGLSQNVDKKSVCGKDNSWRSTRHNNFDFNL